MNKMNPKQNPSKGESKVVNLTITVDSIIQLIEGVNLVTAEGDIEIVLRPYPVDQVGLLNTLNEISMHFAKKSKELKRTSSILKSNPQPTPDDEQ